MSDLVFEERSAKTMIDDVIAEVQLKFSKKPAEERAFIIIRGYFDASERMWEEGDLMPDHLSAEFHAWFDDPRNHAAKMRALDRVMEMNEEIWHKYGLCCQKCSKTTDNEQDMPDFDRLKQIFGNNQTRI